MYLRPVSFGAGRRVLWRYLSSDTPKDPSKTPKKKRKPKKHYAEVLQVGTHSSSLVQRRVAKLDPAQWPGVQPGSAALSEAVQPPPELADAEEEAADALPEAVRVTPLGCFEPAVGDEAEELEEEVSALELDKKLQDKKRRSTTLPRGEAREKAASLKQLEMQKAGRQASFLSSLHSYLEVCVNSGLVNRAYNTLLYYRNLNRNFQRTTDVRDIRLYNTLLAGFAKKGQLERVSDVLKVLRDDRVTPDAESFSLVFQCLGRQQRTAENVRFARHLLQEMDDAGVRLADATGLSVNGASRSLVIKALTWADPRRARSWPGVPVRYSCALVDHLNADMETHQVESPAMDVQLEQSYEELAKEQISNELAGTVTVASVFRPSDEEVPRSREHSNAYMSRLEADWEKSLTAGFLRNLSPVRQQFHSNQMSRCISLYPYLTGMDVREYVRLMLTEIQGHLAGSGQQVLGRSSLHRRLGELAMKRYQSHVKQSSGLVDRLMAVYHDYLKCYSGNDSPGYLPRERWCQLVAERRDCPDLEHWDRGWSPVIISSVGQFLYKLILHDVKIDPSITKLARLTEHPIPAFYTVFRQDGPRHREVVKPHPALVRLYRATRRHRITFDTNLVPMVSPPLPWVSARTGGYLMSSSQLMRIRASGQTSSQLQRLEETPKQQLYPVLDSLNQLGAVPWIINKQILDIVVHLFNNNGCDELDIPSPVSQMPPLPAVESSMTPSEKYRVKRLRAQMTRRKAEQFGLWCDALYKLSLASHFRDRVLWLPHTVDFRGRAYPCPPHLSHLGSDLSRSLLKFARGKPLGERGLDWLKVHLINLTGLKKREPTSERLRYCNEILDDILDSADNPLTGAGWWRASEEPWQTLASCQELAAALRAPDPRAFVSHLPVHQDGSCNGLQHYAALGRDAAGAASVNLAPAERPQDVYSGVAALVEQQRAKDAEDGLPIAAALEGFVRRKVIKQTVMTTVYGVTRYGARLQIAKQLNNIADFPKEHVWQGSHYLVTRTFLSLQQMFTAAKEIQDWFTECARVVSSVRGESVEWVTPLGLPVIQPYFRNSHKAAARPLSDTGRMNTPHFYHEAYDRPNAMKQRNAFPPNFIHSLDSSHMMLTSLHCQHAGITFVSVHDCYWTHACSVDAMNKVCREQFVALHSRPILEELSEGLVARFGYPAEAAAAAAAAAGTGAGAGAAATAPVEPASRARVNSVLSAVPIQGDFDLRQVLESVYFFS